MNFDFGQVNFLAVIVAALGTFVLGGLWYTALYGQLWQRLEGFSDEKLKQMQAEKPPIVFFGTLILCYFFVAMVVAVLVANFGVYSYRQGLGVGLTLWVLVAAVQMTGHISEDKPLGLFLLNTSYQLIYMAGMGTLIGGWR